MISEEWEYYAPNEEIEEIIKASERKTNLFEKLCSFDDSDAGGKAKISGMTFTQNPNYFGSKRMADSPDKPSISRKGIYCPVCKMLFFPEKDGQGFCNDDCRSEFVKAKAIERAKAKQAELKIDPELKRQRKKERYSAERERYVRDIRSKIGELWYTGKTIKEIADILSINQATVTRWKRLLGLAPRISPKHPAIESPCEACGLIFRALVWRKKRFCSIKCATKATGGRKKTRSN